MKHRTKLLTGLALDYAVAKSQMLTPRITDHRIVEGAKQIKVEMNRVFSPSTDWAQGGVIIDKYISHLKHDGDTWQAVNCDGHGHFALGATALEAAMRCYVISKLGHEIDIPEEVINHG